MEPEIEEFIPEDGFDHIKGTSCLCNPTVYAIPFMGSGVIHKRMLTDQAIQDWMEGEPES